MPPSWVERGIEPQSSLITTLLENLLPVHGVRDIHSVIILCTHDRYALSCSTFHYNTTDVRMCRMFYFRRDSNPYFFPQKHKDPLINEPADDFK